MYYKSLSFLKTIYICKPMNHVCDNCLYNDRTALNKKCFFLYI